MRTEGTEKVKKVKKYPKKFFKIYKKIFYFLFKIFQTFFYFSCTTKDNCVIIFEMQFIKKNNFYAEVKYKSETNQKELHFENFIMMILTDNLTNNETEYVCR